MEKKLKATALLLSYSRQENLKLIIDSLKRQTVGIEIFLWNNDLKDKTEYNVDLQINSSKNLMCWPRWFMAHYSSSDFVFSLDDDLIFRDPLVIEDCIKYCSDNQDTAIGAYGVQLNKEKDYWNSRHLPCLEKDENVDIIKGRFIFCHKDLINQNMKHRASIQSPRIEDDMFISSNIEKKILPAFLKRRFLNLPDSEGGLYSKPEHRPSRSENCSRLFL